MIFIIIVWNKKEISTCFHLGRTPDRWYLLNNEANEVSVCTDDTHQNVPNFPHYFFNPSTLSFDHAQTLPQGFPKVSSEVQGHQSTCLGPLPEKEGPGQAPGLTSGFFWTLSTEQQRRACQRYRPTEEQGSVGWSELSGAPKAVFPKYLLRISFWF